MFLQGTLEPFIVKTDYKNLMGFLTTKELNRRQVRWAEMLLEYYFKIKYVKGIDNAKVNILSWQAKLQGTEKPLRAMLKLYKDGKIRYNHPKLAATQEYETLESDWEQRINKAQSRNKSLDNYTN